MLINARRSVLLLVDVQENLAPVMADARAVYRHCGTLAAAAGKLQVPVVVSEQYPKGLGPTVADLRQRAPDATYLEKIHFSCGAEPAIKAHLEGLQRDQIVIAGIEAHVCVLQSALDLKAQGYEVFVVGDACSSRLVGNHQAALARMAAAGVSVVTTEMAVFEWLHRAGTPEFRDVLGLIK